MSRPIFKVTSKKITEILSKEKKRRDSFMSKVTRKVKKIMPEVLSVSYRDDSWDGKRIPRGLVFKDEYEVNLNKWKPLDRVVYKKKWRTTYWPKRNTSAGKLLAKKFSEVMEPEQFFQDKDLAVLIKYQPKKKVSNITANTIRVNTLQFGYAEHKGNTLFVFGGYEGYKAPRGVKEMLMSEYERIFK